MHAACLLRCGAAASCPETKASLLKTTIYHPQCSAVEPPLHSQAYRIIEKAADVGALVVFTLVEPSLIRAVATACRLHGLRHVDLWGGLLEALEGHLQAARAGVPGMRRRQAALSPDYFR